MATSTETRHSFRYQGHVHQNGNWNLDGTIVPGEAILRVQSPDPRGVIGEVEVVLAPDVKLEDCICYDACICGRQVLYLLRKTNSAQICQIPIQRVVSRQAHTVDTTVYTKREERVA